MPSWIQAAYPTTGNGSISFWVSFYRFTGFKISPAILRELTFRDLILNIAPNDGQDHKEGFPGLVDWITLLEGESLEGSDYLIFIEVLKVHYTTVVNTISNAIKIIEEVHIL